MVAWEVFRQKPKKLLVNVGFDAVAVSRVEPHHVSLSSSAFSFRLFPLKGKPHMAADTMVQPCLQRQHQNQHWQGVFQASV